LEKFLTTRGYKDVMKLRQAGLLLINMICNSFIGLAFSHGLGEQTLIKTPQGFKKIEVIAQHVSKNKRIISYSENKQKSIPSSVRTAGYSTTNCHIRIAFHIPGTTDLDEIQCTPTQEFYVPAINSWVPAYNLHEGDQLKSNLYETVIIKQLDLIQGPLSVYMLEVKKYHNFLISKQEILTHNVAMPWEVAIWICIPFGDAVTGASAGSIFGPIGIMGGAIIGSILGYGLQCVADYDKVHIYDSFFNVNSIDALMKKSFNLSESSTNSKPSASTPSPGGSSTSEETPSADQPQTTCPIEKILKGLTKDPREKSRKPNDPRYSDIYEKPDGDISKDEKELPLKDIRTVINSDGVEIRLGTLPDGRIINIRNKSRDGRPTIEIQDKKTKKFTKIRYGKK